MKGTIDQELHFQKSEGRLRLEGYSGWAANKTDRRSTTGYCFSLTENGPVISWKSKKRQTVALSTCAAESMALAATSQESLYLVQLLRGMCRIKRLGWQRCVFLPIVNISLPEHLIAAEMSTVTVNFSRCPKNVLSSWKNTKAKVDI